MLNLYYFILLNIILFSQLYSQCNARVTYYNFYESVTYENIEILTIESILLFLVYKRKSKTAGIQFIISF